GSITSSARQRPEKPINSDTLAEMQKLDGVASIEVLLALPPLPDVALTIDGKTFPISIPERSPQARIFNPANTPPLAGKVLDNTPDARGIVLSARLLQGAGYSQPQYAGLIGKPATLTVTAPRGHQQTFP